MIRWMTMVACVGMAVRAVHHGKYESHYSRLRVGGYVYITHPALLHTALGIVLLQSETRSSNHPASTPSRAI